MAGMCRSAAVLALLTSAEAQTPSVSTRVEQTQTWKAGYSTYRVMCQFDSTASEVYALFGEAGAMLVIPPAFQQAAPFGADVGPVHKTHGDERAADWARAAVPFVLQMTHEAAGETVRVPGFR